MGRSAVCRTRNGRCGSPRSTAARDPNGSCYIGMPTHSFIASAWSRRLGSPVANPPTELDVVFAQPPLRPEGGAVLFIQLGNIVGRSTGRIGRSWLVWVRSYDPVGVKPNLAMECSSMGRA